MEILFIRHGKTRGNLEGRYVGRTDEPLLPEVSEQLARTEYFRFQPDVVYTSSLLRCRQTAKLLFCREAEGSRTNNVWTGLPDAAYTDFSERTVIFPGLEETDFGIFEYKNYEELKQNPVYQNWIDSGGMAAIPGGESGEQFRRRCRRTFLRCLEDARRRQAQRAAFVIHGGTIMAVMEAFGHPRRGFYDWQIKNGEGLLTELKQTGEGFVLEFEEKVDGSGKESRDGFWKICDGRKGYGAGAKDLPEGFCGRTGD